MAKLKDMKGMQGISLEQVKEKAKVDALKPGEKEAVAAFGENRIERRYRKDGNYSWRVKFKTNENGTITQDGHKAMEMLMPWARADSERHLRNQASVQRVALKDEAGSVQYVPEFQAAQTERRNGWRAGHRIVVHARADRVHARRCQGCGEFFFYCECERGT